MMKTSPKLPHHERAETFARSLFTDAETPTVRVAMSRASINMPAGLLMAIDAVAAQGTGGNRSAAAVKLIELGYGLLLEYLPEDQRAYMQELALQQSASDLVSDEGDE